MPFGVSIKPRYRTLVAPNSHLGNLAFKPTFLSLKKVFLIAANVLHGSLSVLVVDRRCTQ
jgi:hypothetical protein